MQSTLFDTLLSNESMFNNNNNNNSTTRKENNLDISDDSLLNNMETSVTPVNNDKNTNNSDNYVLTKKEDSNIIRPNSNRAESYSSQTTKLNTANNSFLDLQKLNLSNNAITANNSTITATTIAQNVENITTPSVMNDLMALLDQQEIDEKLMKPTNEQNYSHLLSPKASQNNTDFMDINEDVLIDSNVNEQDTGSWRQLVDSFVQPADLHSNINHVNKYRKNSFVEDPISFNNSNNNNNNMAFGARRASELLTSEMTKNFNSNNNQRSSISDSIDFWGLSQGSNKISPNDEIDYTNNENFIDNSLSQSLNDYNMNFNNNVQLPKKRNSSSTSYNNNNTITNIQENIYETNDISNSNILSSPRQSNNIINDFKFQPIMKTNNLTQNSIMSPDTRGNELFFNLYNQNDSNTLSNNLDMYNMSMSSDDNKLTEQNGLITDDLSSPTKKFIKPSMMLSESASLTAKLAITGLQKKPETFPTIDTQAYHHPTKIVKRKSVSSSVPPNSRNDSTRRRRKSTIGITNSQSSNAMTPFVTSPRTSTSSASSSKRNSNVNTHTPMAAATAAAILEDPSIKPFQCQDCEKAFRRSEHLKRHVRSVHSTERPFPCMLCEKKFSRSDNLSQHLKTHKKHGDF